MAEKLSGLQKFILVSLLIPQRQLLSRKKFSRYVYEKYFGAEAPSIRANLSRAYERLQDRGFLRTKRNRWTLTKQDRFEENGFVVALVELNELVKEAKAKGEIDRYVKEAWQAMAEIWSKSKTKETDS
jgi:hypothetical protein